MKKLCIHLCLGLLMFSIACTYETDSPDSAPVPGRYSSKIALDWMDLATSMVRSVALPPAPSIRIYAYSSLGLYESQLPEMKDYQSMSTYFSGQTSAFDPNKKYCGPATANTAMASLLRKFLTAECFRKSIDSLESSYSLLENAVEDKERLANSIQFDQQLADVIFEWRSKDGALTPCPPWVEPVGPDLGKRIAEISQQVAFKNQIHSPVNLPL